jgi:ISXO2-like transposase domain
MLHRIRLAMKTGTFLKLSGKVEADETFIGGAARFMHKDRKERRMGGKHGGLTGKTAVMGLLERHGPDKTSRVRAFIVPTVRKNTPGPEVRANVAPGSEIITDALKSYEGLDDEYTHNVIDHAEAYVRGHVHTNGMENFWSLLKRAIKGTYVAVEPWHLFRYVDEEVFRYNERRDSRGDGGRFAKVLGSVTGRRITYRTLTGKPALA